jgi:hypothetical protein
MISIVSKAALAALVSFGAIGATAATADAASLVVTTGPVYHRPFYRHPVVVVRTPIVVASNRGRCAPGMALEKAHWNGLNRVQLSHVGPYRLTVDGRMGGHFAQITFANARGCPIIAR